MALRLRTTDRLFTRFCRTGDPLALGRVFDRTGRHLLHVAAWLAGNRHDAEDLLQRTFLTAIEDRGSFARERSVLPWLVGILTNHARNLRRERARRAALPTTEDRIDDPIARAADRELLEALTKARAALVSPYREVLELHIEQGLNSKEIAERLGRPAGTVRTQLVRALELLRRRLPNGFVAGLAPVAVDPGALVAVKAAVLAAAKNAGPVAAAGMAGATTTVVATGGVLMAKKIVLVVPMFALLLGVGAYVAWPTAREQPATAQPPSSIATADLDRTEATTPNAGVPVVEPAPARQAVPSPSADDADPGFASLRVHVRWKHDGSAARSVGIRAYSFSLPPLCWRTAVTDAEGIAVLRHLAPGTYHLGGTHLNDAPEVTLAADRQEQVDLLAERACIVRGRVVDHDGLPVSEASICAHGNKSDARLGLSDSGGRFAVPLLQNTVLIARKAGHVSSYGRSLRPETGKDFDVELALRGKGGAVHGMVRDGNGVGIGWATVQIGRRGGHVVPSGSPDIHLTMPYATRVLTGRDGAFTVDDVPPGESPLVAWAVGFGPIHQSITVQPDEVTQLAITLPAGAIVAGIVRDTAGQPVGSARVWFGEEFVRFPTASVTADADGRFRLADLPSGPVRLHAAKEQSKATASVQLLAGTTTEWNPVLGKGRTISGIVLGPDERPFVGAKVGTVHPNYQKVMRWFETDAAGRFELTNVGDKPQPLQVESGGASLVETAKLAPDTRDVVIRIGARDLPTARLRGRIVDALGRPAIGSIHARRPPLTNSDSQQLDKDTGNFAYGPMPAGDYELSAWAEGYGSISLGTITLEPGQERVLEDTVLQVPGEVELTVLDAAGRLVDVDHTTLRTASGHATQGCEIRRGKGRLSLLQPGRYFFECSTGRTESARAEFAIRSAVTMAIELRGQQVVQAQIQFRDPEPPTPGLFVKMHVNTADGHLAGFTQTFPQNPEPLVQLLHLPPGAYRLDCRASDGRAVEAELTIRSVDDRPELTIDLPRR